ncbi:PCRF domain-containing protein, partial [Shewanella sp. 0m-11]
MKDSVIRKLEGLLERNEEVLALLSDAGVIADQERFRALSKEYSQLEDVVRTFKAFQQAEEDLESAKEMMEEDDAELKEMAQEEFKVAKSAIAVLEDELQILLLPKDPNDDNNCFIEIRAGAGG